jgi:hypothetical protein
MKRIYIATFNKLLTFTFSLIVFTNSKSKQLFVKTILILILLIVSTTINAQKVSLLFSKSILNKTGKIMSVELADSTGAVNPSAEFFNSTDKIYFVVKAIEGQTWTFSSKDAERKLPELKILQSNNAINAKPVKTIVANDEINAVVVAFNKSQVSILKEFKFKFEETESENINIPEKLWPKYKKYLEIIANAQSFSQNEDYLNAFKNISKLWNKDTLLPKFSFYASIKDSLIDYSYKIIANTNAQFVKQNESYKTNINEQNLTFLFLTKDSIIETLSIVDSFLTSIKTELDIEPIQLKINNQEKNINTDLEKAKSLFRKKRLAIFEEKNYQDYQFKLFTEAISKLLTSVEKIKQISIFDSINYNQLKNFQTLNKEIKEMGWAIEFKSVCDLLNENITRFGYIFNDTAINNYSQNKPNEPQPYFALFKAYNALVKKDKRTFIELVDQSIYSIYDKELLSNLDLYIALVNGDLVNNTDYWETLQKGYNAQTNGLLQEAKLSYEKAEKLYNNNEILYLLLAETCLKLGDRYSAEIYFKRAVTINPKFILPKIYQIDFLIEDKDFETAFGLVNSALETNPIWYFNYKKALILGLTGKYNDAKTILLTKCVTQNPSNYEQYLTLGDMHNSLGDIKSARESYMKAGSLKPNDSAYKARMELLKQSQEPKPTK